MDRPLLKYTVVILATLLLVLGVFLIPVALSGDRPITSIESIDGIRFPCPHDCHITEKLAHVDVELKEPVFAKELQLTLTFAPYDTPTLYVGVRENSFWLSYPWQKIYDAAETSNQPSPQLITQTVTIPLTDKLQDIDRSIDVMFLAGDPKTLNQPDAGEEDTTYWHLNHLRAAVAPVFPSLPQIKNYAASIIKRERPL